MTNLILGGGLAGLATSYHASHAGCEVIERGAQLGGHATSIRRGGFTWDEGPHVSFTKQPYVRELFEELIGGALEEQVARVGNYDSGDWIDHPAQTSLYQVSEPLRGRCLESFLASRGDTREPADYEQWLDIAFGPVFARAFPHRYTRKYWTTEPRNLTVDWVGGRVHRPNVEQVLTGARGPLPESTHYVKTYRYPTVGGFEAFVRPFAAGARARLGATVEGVDLDGRRVRLSTGELLSYSSLVSTLPLPRFVGLVSGVPSSVLEAAETLTCTELVLVEVEVPRPCPRPEHWIYVYDEDKWSTRITVGERLSASNAPPGFSAVQVEVYFSRYRPRAIGLEALAGEVLLELAEMGLAAPPGTDGQRVWTRQVPWANVLYDHETRGALDHVLRFLETKGLLREHDDLAPMTDWSAARDLPASPLMLAGRYGQWKYFWSDDCVLRGRELARRLARSR